MPQWRVTIKGPTPPVAEGWSSAGSMSGDYTHAQITVDAEKVTVESDTVCFWQTVQKTLPEGGEEPFTYPDDELVRAISGFVDIVRCM
jgi:hypothetical protein